MSIFEHAFNLMQNQDPKSLEKSIDNCHHKGLFSLVIGGTENGNLTRVFIATEDVNFSDIAFHDHCYDLSIGVIKGEFINHTAEEADKMPDTTLFDWVELDKWLYHSKLRGGNGKLSFVDTEHYYIQSNYIPIGGSFYMEHFQVHTVSVKKGTMWVLQEHGFQAKESKVLGVPFETNGLYTAPKQYQVNNMWEMAYKELKAYIDLKQLKMKG